MYFRCFDVNYRINRLPITFPHDAFQLYPMCQENVDANQIAMIIAITMTIAMIILFRKRRSDMKEVNVEWISNTFRKEE